MIPGFAEFEESTQEKMATVVYYVIVAILGVNAGIAAFESLKAAHWIPGGVEAILSAIKSGEIGEFLASTFKAILS